VICEVLAGTFDISGIPLLCDILVSENGAVTCFFKRNARSSPLLIAHQRELIAAIDEHEKEAPLVREEWRPLIP
jgi:hypothetical protein